MAKIIEIKESDINSGHVMEKTAPVKADARTVINVPEGYTAVVFSNGKRFGQCGSCGAKKLKKVIGSDVVGRSISVLYINGRGLSDMSWGVGNIPIKYTPDGREIEIQVGASGTFLASIVDPVAFYARYGQEEGALTLPEITSYITDGFRRYARELIAELFCEAAEPIIETDFMLDEADLRFEERICGRTVDTLPGVVFKSVNVSTITVREEDVDALREFYKARKRKK